MPEEHTDQSFTWPPGDGEMARRIREHDWTTTPLGPVETWPASLRMALTMVLAMPSPASILWGPSAVQLYNDAYVAIARDRHPALLGRPAAEGWPDAYAGVIAPLLEAVRAGKATQLTNYAVTLRGQSGQLEERIFDTDWSPIRADPDVRHPKGEVAGALQTLIEMTEWRRAETVLRESETRHRLLIASWAQAMWETDAEGVVVADSPSWRIHTGQTLDEWLGYGWLDAVHPDDRAYAERQWREAIAVRGLADAEFRLRSTTGRWRWTNVRAAPVLDSVGKVEKWVGINIDIDARKRTETDLRESEARLRTLMENVPQLVWRAAADGAWTWASPQWTAYTGQSDADSHGEGWLNALHPADRDLAHAAWRDAPAHGLLQLDHRVRHAATGHYCWFQTRGVPMYDAEGRITEWLGTCTDIDDQMQARAVLSRFGEDQERQVGERTGELMAAEAQLRQHEKLTAIGQLTGGIAHDFNNMLQGFGSSLDLIRALNETGEREGLDVYFDRAQQSVDRAAALVRRMLAFARQQDLEPRAIDVDAVAQSMEEMIRRTVGPAVQVELQLQDGAWFVWCDPGQLENALLNLCINARDAMPEGGWLTIGTEEVELDAKQVARHADAKPGRYVCLSVRDTGSGIPPEVLDRVFEPFFTTKPIGAGTGLGLSQVYGFVRQSGGFIGLDTSVEPGSGRGTTVRMRFPFHSDNPEQRRTGRDRLNGPTVLLVEDQLDIRAASADYLRLLGYRVVEAENGPMALRVFDSGAIIDMLVTDQGMPGGMTGTQLIIHAREKRPDLPALLTTGFAELPELPSAPALRKPYKLSRLAELIRKALPGENSPDTSP